MSVATVKVDDGDVILHLRGVRRHEQALVLAELVLAAARAGAELLPEDCDKVTVCRTLERQWKKERR